MIQPTRLAVLLFVSTLIPSMLLMIYWPAQGWLFINVSMLILLVMVADAVLALPRQLLQPAFSTPGMLFVGHTSALKVSFSSTRHPWSTVVELVLDYDGPADPHPPVVAVFKPGLKADATIPIRPQRRGVIRLHKLWARWRGPLRLMQFGRTFVAERTIPVVPTVRALQDSDLTFYFQEALHGQKVQRYRGKGGEFDALIEFADGHDHRLIDWKQSARHRKLLCKEFTAERNHHVVMAFDSGYLMNEPIDGMPRIDHAINSALMLSWVALRSGDLVGLLNFDSEPRLFLPPMRGIASYRHIENCSASIQYANVETNYSRAITHLNEVLRQRSLVIAFSEFIDVTTLEILVEHLGRLAKRHVVIFVTMRAQLLPSLLDQPPADLRAMAESAIAHDLLRERWLLLERLERLGIHCIDVSAGRLPIALLNRYLSVKWQELMT